ncbi:UDP-2,3-diacylglucosamine diphosphatase [Ectothiorhodospiraceae bacterium 2226]|nr:UDP-2,3-diacylglucosamine diphosphatase [Ectothiorhodospiraceae bacterium 2226]
MITLFISDLHLEGNRPHIAQRFVRFLQEDAVRADALYILGDLFEAWLGDDVIVPEVQPIMQALRATSAATPVYLMHGNRDFLLGEGFAEATGVHLLPDPSVIDLYGTPTLLMHGDSLCTDDAQYQQFRAMVRDPAWQAQALALNPEARIAKARELRAMSREANTMKAEDIMDVNADAVVAVLREHGVRRLIHGHTHRPAHHTLSVDGAPAERWVLKDWDTEGGVLECDAAGCRARTLD